MVSGIHKQAKQIDYAEILAQISFDPKCNFYSISDPEQLEAVLSVVKETIDLVQDRYLVIFKKKCI